MYMIQQRKKKIVKTSEDSFQADINYLDVNCLPINNGMLHQETQNNAS